MKNGGVFVKKIICLLLLFSVFFYGALAFAASDENWVGEEESIADPEVRDDILVEINGKITTFDVPPEIVDGRTMVPMRKIFETLGANIQWLEKTNQILAIKGEKAIVMKIDTPAILIKNFRDDSEQIIELDVAPFIKDSRTLVPIRAVSESLNAKVDWVEETRKVVITTEK